MRKIVISLLVMFVAFQVLAAQTAPKEDRVSGTIVRMNMDKSMLVVKENRSAIEHNVFFNASTKWTKEKGVAADMKQFKDGSRVICLGKLNDKGELTATRIDLQEK